MLQDELPLNRAGIYVKQLTGYRAFIPKPLPPDPPLRLDEELLSLLSFADQSLGQLEGVSNMLPYRQLLPAPDLFLDLYVRKEAVSSSQIEGTQATLIDVVEYEAGLAHHPLPADVLETSNYVKALDLGLKLLGELPLCNRMIRQVHAVLMQGVRGQERTPGEFRTSQNWIGRPGSSLNNATYVPPPPFEMNQAMGELELYLNSATPTPSLIMCGLVHGQFEMIHPFLDGNGRVGRLLIALILCHHKALSRPMLYLSDYIQRNQDEYYRRLLAISSEGDWEGWLKYFLKGVGQVAREAAQTAVDLIALREEHQNLIMERVRGRQNGVALLVYLFETPAISVNSIRDKLGVSYTTASNLASDLVRVGILKEITQGTRNKVFVYKPYLDILDKS